MVSQYKSKHHWVEFIDNVVDQKPDGLDLVERSETWTAVRTMFEAIEKEDQCALQMVVIDGMSLRQTAEQLGVSAMTVQRRVKRGLNCLSRGLNKSQVMD